MRATSFSLEQLPCLCTMLAKRVAAANGVMNHRIGRCGRLGVGKHRHHGVVQIAGKDRPRAIHATHRVRLLQHLGHLQHRADWLLLLRDRAAD